MLVGTSESDRLLAETNLSKMLVATNERNRLLAKANLSMNEFVG